ncbi:hypothetical protein LMH73_015890 [Vibrio splendidus]|nr:hypothetical protein [Vibrio splendidus]MCC4881454.1 hypothetical protein [Vibrio splendidus]
MKFLNGIFCFFRRMLVIAYEFKHTLNHLLKLCLVAPLSYIFLEIVRNIQPTIEALHLNASTTDKLLNTHILTLTLTALIIATMFRGVYSIIVNHTLLMSVFIEMNIRFIVLCSLLGLSNKAIVHEYINNPSNSAFLVVGLIAVLYYLNPFNNPRKWLHDNRYSSLSKKFDHISSRVVAIHEAGHFIVYFHYKKSIVNSIRLISMENFGSMFNKELKEMEMEQKVAVLLAGQAAQDLHVKFTPSSTTPFEQGSDYETAFGILGEAGMNQTDSRDLLNKIYNEVLGILQEHNNMLLRVSEEVEKSRVLFKTDLLMCIKGA